jgi:hypothetical protein
MFLNNFLINELAYVKGTYVFDFTIGTINKKYTINVVDLPSVKVESLKIGTTSATLYGGEYTVRPETYVGKIQLELSLNNLLETQYVSVSGVTLDFANAFTAPVETIVSLKDLNTLDLGSLTSVSITTGQKVSYLLKFWNKVPYSTSTTLYQQVGEAQRITLVALADQDTSSAPVLRSIAANSVSPTKIDLDFQVSVASTYYYFVRLASAAAPTRSQVIAQSGSEVQKGTTTLAASTDSSVAVNDLTPNTSYIAYIVAKDNSNNNVSDMLVVPFKTISDALTLTGMSVSTTGTKGVITSATPTVTGSTFVYYAIVASNPTTDLLEVVAGTTTEATLEGASYLNTALIAQPSNFTANETGKFLVAVELDAAQTAGVAGTAKVLAIQIVALGNYA